MKIHISASKASTSTPGVELNLIKKILEKLGHEVRANHILSPDIPKDMKDIAFKKEYKKIHSWIKSSDILIADITAPSNGVGHEIFLALNEGKPVLALYAYDSKAPRDVTVRGNPSRLLKTKSYTKENLEERLRTFCEEVKTKLDTKFILIISPEIDKYIRWSAEKRRKHKAQVVREAIEDKMRKDNEYTKYLSEFD